MPKTMLLLGAGASRAADVPLASEITDLLGTKYSEMGAYVRVEPAQYRATLDFVRDRRREWLSQSDRSSDGFSFEDVVNDLVELATPPENGPFVTHTISEEVRKFRDSVQAENPFDDARKAALFELQEITAISGESDLEYLRDVLNSDTELVIATLNYDQSIEMASNLFDVQVDTGWESWSSHRTFDFSPDAIPLIKVHGSNNWLYSYYRGASAGGGMDQYWTIGAGQSEPFQSKFVEPVMIFGGNKLRANGPYPDLYRQFRLHLFSADRLVVCGYSFLDSHINEAIRVFSAEGGRMAVIDPNVEELAERIQTSCWETQYPFGRAAEPMGPAVVDVLNSDWPLPEG